MQHTLEEIRQFAFELPQDQRFLLASALWESDESDEAEVAAAWDGEIAHRVAEVKAGSGTTCTLEVLEADLRAIVSR